MSAFLLDTNALIHSTTAPRRLGRRARTAIESADELYISAASLWEIAIKHRKRPDLMPQSARAFNVYATSKERVLPLITEDSTLRAYLSNTVW